MHTSKRIKSILTSQKSPNEVIILELKVQNLAFLKINPISHKHYSKSYKKVF